MILRVNNLVGFGAGGSRDVAFVDHGDATSGTISSGDTATLTGLTSSGPHTYVLLTGGADGSTVSISTVTFGGNSMTEKVFVQSAAGDDWAAIYYIAGAQTGDIVVTLSSAISWDAAATAVSATGLRSATNIDTDTAVSDSATSLSLSALTTPGDGGARLVSFSHSASAGTVTPTNLTEMSDIDGGSTRHVAGYDLGDDGTTITCTTTESPGLTRCAMVGISIR